MFLGFTVVFYFKTCIMTVISILHLTMTAVFPFEMSNVKVFVGLVAAKTVSLVVFLGLLRVPYWLC